MKCGRKHWSAQNRSGKAVWHNNPSTLFWLWLTLRFVLLNGVALPKRRLSIQFVPFVCQWEKWKSHLRQLQCESVTLIICSKVHQFHRVCISINLYRIFGIEFVEFVSVIMRFLYRSHRECHGLNEITKKPTLLRYQKQQQQQRQFDLFESILIKVKNILLTDRIACDGGNVIMCKM